MGQLLGELVTIAALVKRAIEPAGEFIARLRQRRLELFDAPVGIGRFDGGDRDRAAGGVGEAELKMRLVSVEIESAFSGEAAIDAGLSGKAMKLLSAEQCEPQLCRGVSAIALGRTVGEKLNSTTREPDRA